MHQPPNSTCQPKRHKRQRNQNNAIEPHVEVKVDGFLSVILHNWIICNEQQRNRNPDGNEQPTEKNRGVSQGRQKLALIAFVSFRSLHLHTIQLKFDYIANISPAYEKNVRENIPPDAGIPE